MVEQAERRTQKSRFGSPAILAVAGAVVAATVGGAYWHFNQPAPRVVAFKPAATDDIDLSGQSRRGDRYFPTPEQWELLTVERVSSAVFRPEIVTEGRILLNEETATPVFSPYAGRVTRLLAKPGDHVEKGAPLFTLEATDMVQAQGDFMSAVAAISKARSRVTLTELLEKQNKSLFDSKAGSLRDFQTAQAEVLQARSDLKTAETMREATRNRLTLLGKTDDEISAFEQKGRISSETPIYAPLSGTVVQRKIGQGQYVSYTSTGSIDPVYTIGDLSTVWLVAYIRESDAGKVNVGQVAEFSVLSMPGQIFQAKIEYIAPSLDPVTRRLAVRASIDNAEGRFKAEMFANVTVFSDGGNATASVPREAVVVDAGKSRVWVVTSDDKAIEARQVTLGATSGRMVQITAGLNPGERIVTKGSLFVDKAATI